MTSRHKKYKRCSKCGEKFWAGYRVGKVYLSGPGGRIIGAYQDQRLWCAKHKPYIYCGEGDET